MSVTGNDWQALLDAEIDSAGSPITAATASRTASLYERTGFEKEGLSLLRRCVRFGVNNPDILPSLLEALTRQRQFTELNRALQVCANLADRPPELRRQVARAFSALGQTVPAAAEWSSLMEQGGMLEDDWLALARFLVNSGDVPSEIAQPLDNQAENLHMYAKQGQSVFRDDKGQAPPSLVSYCMFRARVDNNRTWARKVLPQIRPENIPDVEVVLDLAIGAWRLGAFEKAAEAARCALSMGEAPTAAKSILATIRSFAGDGSQLTPGALAVRREEAKLIRNTAKGVAREAAAWGIIRVKESGKLGLKVLPMSEECEMEVPDMEGIVATFSILPHSRAGDPLVILRGLDWSWPHFMLQRESREERLHSFVEHSGHREWLWNEVIANGKQSPVKGLAESEQVHASSVWRRALQELKEREGDASWQSNNRR